MSLCKRCNGSGSISVRHGLTFETDSAAERALARHQADCPECGNPVKRQEQRIAELVSALEEAKKFVKDEGCDDLYWCAAAKNGAMHDSDQLCGRCAALATIEKALKP